MYVVCFVLIIFIASCGKNKESITVKSSDITESVYASGKVKAIDQYTVYSTVSGVLQNKAVSAGDYVAKGQTILELDNIASELNAQNARIALDLSTENSRKGSDKLKEMELNVNIALEKLQLDSSIYERQKKLREESVITQLEFDQKQSAYQSSLLAYRTAKAKLAQLRLQLQNELQRADITYNINKKLNTDYTIKSAVNGKVYDILKEKGELVTPQNPLAVIGKADSFLLELEVDENDIVKINIGQKALITMDSYKGEVLEAIVDKIYPIMNERTRTFSLEAHFITPPKKLFPNLTAEANIIIQTKKHTIAIPNNYIVDKKFVIVNKDQKREIKIGLKDYQKTEVIEGLTENEILYKP
jgi:multidrug efflux pump subunit AcrA (membrane-fusion protein)